MNWIEIVSLVMNVAFGGSFFIVLATLRATRKKAHSEAEIAKAGAKSKMIENEESIIDLYKKVYSELSATLKSEYDKVVDRQSNLESLIAKLSKEINRLERAIKNVSKCPHSKDCPVTDELQKIKNETDNEK